MNILGLVRKNLPSSKPQLWANLPYSVLRRARIQWATWRDPAWFQRPQSVRLVGGGPLMEVVPADAIGRSIYLYGNFEVAESAFVRRALRAGDSFVDVGANAGYFTLLAADRVGPGGKVFAFEPVDRIRAQMERSIQLNRMPQVVVRAEAVWSEPGLVDFFDAEPGPNSGVSSILPGAGRSASRRSVPAVSLDSEFAGAGRPPRLIKIDVEGAELGVLQGGRALLTGQDRPLVVLETFDPAEVGRLAATLGLSMRRVVFDARRKFVLASEGTRVEDPMAAYEAPGYVLATPRRFEAEFGDHLVGTLQG